jgi:hypothetical protein
MADDPVKPDPATDQGSDPLTDQNGETDHSKIVEDLKQAAAEVARSQFLKVCTRKSN